MVGNITIDELAVALPVITVPRTATRRLQILAQQCPDEQGLLLLLNQHETDRSAVPLVDGEVPYIVSAFYPVVSMADIPLKPELRSYLRQERRLAIGDYLSENPHIASIPFFATELRAPLARFCTVPYVESVQVTQDGLAFNYSQPIRIIDDPNNADFFSQSLDEFRAALAKHESKYTHLAEFTSARRVK
jgi:hypothetical protein